MGEEAGDVLATTSIAAEDRAKYDPVMKQLDDFFKVCHIIFERAGSSIVDINSLVRVWNSTLQCCTDWWRRVTKARQKMSYYVIG